jgi:hypothetical protein
MGPMGPGAPLGPRRTGPRQAHFRFIDSTTEGKTFSAERPMTYPPSPISMIFHNFSASASARLGADQPSQRAEAPGDLQHLVHHDSTSITPAFFSSRRSSACTFSRARMAAW